MVSAVQPASEVARLSRGRIPGLDGLRAVAVSLVLISHVLIHEDALHGRALEVQYVWGEDGVVLFFALSGFLITTLLLRENAREGRISLAGFYLRRTLRIWPVWYAYMLAVAVMVAVGWWNVAPRDWLGAATYTLNMVPNHNGAPLGHGWSLAIEEQFYLVWPLVLIYLLRRRRSLLPVVAVAALSAPLWRAATWELFPWVQQFGRQSTINRAGALLAGCLVAVLLSDPAWRDRFRTTVSRQTVLLAVALVVVAPLVEVTQFGARMDVALGPSLSDLPLAYLVGAVAVGRTPAALTWWPVAGLGLMSYSVYVWQQAILLHPNVPVVVGLPGSLLVGLMSWRLIELRTGRVKDHFQAKSLVRSEPRPTGS